MYWSTNSRVLRVSVFVLSVGGGGSERCVSLRVVMAQFLLTARP